MNLKLTIGLLGVFLAAMVVFLVVDDPPPDRPPSLDLWPDFAAADVEEMSFTSEFGEIHVRRSGTGEEEWEVRTGDKWVPAEADPILDILNEIERLDIRSRQPGNDVDAQLRLDAGLSPATYWFSYRMRGETHRLDLGKPGIGRDTIYATLEGSDDLIVMGDGLMDTIHPISIDHLRRRRIFRWAVRDVDRIEVERDGRSVLKARRLAKQHAFWWAEAPFVGYLDDMAIESSLLGWMLKLEASAFVSDSPDVVALGEAGLIEPRFRVRLHKGRGEDEVKTILFGAEAPEGGVFFKVEEQPILYRGNAKGLLGHLSKDPAEFRDRNLSRLGRFPIAEFSGRLGETTFRVKREEGGWTVVEPEGMSADSASVEAWFDAVRAATILEFIDGPDRAALGFDEPAGRLTFLRPLEPDERAIGARVPPLVDLLIGKETERGVYVMRVDQPDPAFLAPKGVLELLRGGAWPFRARAVFDFKPRRLPPTLVERTGGAAPIQTEWKDEAWTKNADAGAVRDLVDALLELKAVRWVGPAVGQEEKYGVGAAPDGSLYVTFGSGTDAKRYGLFFGRETAGGRYARAVREGVPGEAVFILATSVFDAMNLPLEK